jgi:hypothetical protein
MSHPTHLMTSRATHCVRVAARTNGGHSVSDPHCLQTGRGAGVKGWGTWRIEGVCNHHSGQRGEQAGSARHPEGRLRAGSTSHAQSRGRRGARELGERSR